MLKKNTLLFAFSSLAFFGASLLAADIAKADITLNCPRDIRILAIDGKNAKVRKSTRLPNGTHQLAIRLVKDIGKTFDADMQYSDVMVLKFRAEDTTLNFILPRIKDIYDIKRFNKNLSVKLTDESGREIALAKDRLLFEGFQLMRNYPQELAQYNATDAPAAVPALAGGGFTRYAESRKSAAAPAGTLNNSDNSTAGYQGGAAAKNKEKMAEEMLNYWYQQADEKTRAEFLKKLGQ